MRNPVLGRLGVPIRKTAGGYLSESKRRRKRRKRPGTSTEESGETRQEGCIPTDWESRAAVETE